MNSLRLAAFALVCAVAPAFANTATLSADNSTLAPSGGTVAFTATASYEGQPGALGWSITLPAEWSLVSVSGPNVPTIAPAAGTTGTLEFAFTSVPAQRAEFTVLVSYPANAKSTAATSTALIRAGGKLATLKPAPVQLSGVPVEERASRN
jgi:hypothetical protein